MLLIFCELSSFCICFYLKKISRLRPSVNVNERWIWNRCNFTWFIGFIIAGGSQQPSETVLISLFWCLGHNGIDFNRHVSSDLMTFMCDIIPKTVRNAAIWLVRIISFAWPVQSLGLLGHGDCTFYTPWVGNSSQIREFKVSFYFYKHDESNRIWSHLIIFVILVWSHVFTNWGFPKICSTFGLWEITLLLSQLQEIVHAGGVGAVLLTAAVSFLQLQQQSLQTRMRK